MSCFAKFPCWLCVLVEVESDGPCAGFSSFSSSRLLRPKILRHARSESARYPSRTSLPPMCSTSLLMLVCRRFSKHAEPIARVLIEEFGLTEKTIPVARLGGTAGGLKVFAVSSLAIADILLFLLSAVSL